LAFYLLASPAKAIEIDRVLLFRLGGLMNDPHTYRPEKAAAPRAVAVHMEEALIVALLHNVAAAEASASSHAVAAGSTSAGLDRKAAVVVDTQAEVGKNHLLLAVGHTHHHRNTNLVAFSL
jgi:hypothetical protein